MPPVRTLSARANKTERTHEENVERAFIAASRRSDRTLEARVESARRASEIHKARTGRGLKITAKDVQNEEMYEEEDDDLPLQYRHLTAGFQTSSPEFNKRFAAYLTTHVAIRTALEQSIIQSYQQQLEQQQQQQQPGQSLPHQIQPKQYEMFPSPFNSNHAQQQQWTTSPTQGSPTTRYSPYPILLRTNVGTPSSETLISPTKNSIPPFSADSSNPQSQSVSNNLDLTSYGPLSTNLPAETQAFLGNSMGLGGTFSGLSSMVGPQEGIVDSFKQSLKPTKPSNESSPEVKTDTGELDMTLLREASVQDSPYLFGCSNYFDDALRTDNNLALTPTSNNEENDWTQFVESSDWSFHEDCSII